MSKSMIPPIAAENPMRQRVNSALKRMEMAIAVCHEMNQASAESDDSNDRSMALCKQLLEMASVELEQAVLATQLATQKHRPATA